jgi:hypothetical protein
MTGRTISLREAYILAAVGWPMLIVYGVAQATLALAVAPQHPQLRLVIEPYLLLFGLVLHVQWRGVDRAFRQQELSRPWWMAAADCLSFVITFWAVAVLMSAFVA